MGRAASRGAGHGRELEESIVGCDTQFSKQDTRPGDNPIKEEPGSAYNKVQDSGARQSFTTGSVRDTRDGKGRYDLLPVYAISRLARHYENGAVKYGDRNWEKWQPLTRYLDSALRHTFKLLGRQADEDHAAAAVWNLLAYIETLHRIELGQLPSDLDDLPPLYA